MSGARLPGIKRKKPFRPKRRVILRAGNVPQNRKHREFIKTLPCILSGDERHVCHGVTEAAHCGVDHGMRRKSPDETCLPMCSNLHRTGKFSHHSLPRTFWDHWKLDREALILEYQARGVIEGTITEVHLERLRGKQA